ncbi:MAG: winged helix-turn-helix domain-containing protein [Rhodoferax sp.]|uniref:ATP-binding protein n=1 Tax=Rhodoferax sp. TaxID=50421 RepID=UPI00262F853E|nr:winged helix-turn-helix domain-containing protein [Rhodoferax sp.]MDD5334118.1 winged helix-turn-helix domain-containing protein [Rhodoferax sp.]
MPFSAAAVCAVAVAARRGKYHTREMFLPHRYRFESFEVCASGRQLWIQGQPVALGSRALDVLLALARHPQQTVTKAQLLNLVWPDSMVEENNLTVQISNLRKLLGPKAIATIAGRGYRLTAGLLRPTVTTPDSSRPRVGPAVAGPPVLAQPSSQLFGRDEDIAALHDLLDRHPLVTVMGAGGIGKTSLAQAVARRRLQPQAPAVAWVDLSQLSNPAQLAEAIANALNIHLGAAQDAMTSLLMALAPLRLLMVLDNAEHLVQDVAKAVSAILGGARNVRILVTSQLALRLPGEQLYRVGSLALPREQVSPVEAGRYGAVALLVNRAQTAHPQFVLTDANVGSVIEICRQLDGLPLALELAAVRLPLLGVEGVLERLHDRFKLLVRSQRFAPDRQQTLRAALDWSHELLPPEQQVVFRRLGVFSGGFTMGLAGAVAAQDGDDEWAVIEHLDALVDRALVVVEGGDLPRYHLLETPRAYALEQLERAGEADTIRRRQAQALCGLCEAIAQDFIVESDIVFLQRYQPELDNFRSALNWSLAHDPDGAVALTGAVARIHNFLSSDLEALEYMEAADRLVSAQTPPLLVARLRVGRAFFSRSQHLATALGGLREAIALFRELDQSVEFAHAVANFCYRCHAQDLADVELLCVEARQVCAGDLRPNVRFTLVFADFAQAMHRGRFDEMHCLLDECMALAVAGGYDDYVQLVTWNQAMLAIRSGDYAEAKAMGRDIVELAKQRHGNTSWILNGCAVIMLSCAGLGRWGEAQLAARQFAAIAVPMNRFHEFSDVVAMLLAEHGDAMGAARMLGYADAMCERLQAKRVENFRVQTLDLISPQLGASRLQILLTLGRRLGPEEINLLVDSVSLGTGATE